MGNKMNMELIKEKDIVISKKRTITIELYNITERNKGKTSKYKKILLRNKGEKFSFYERFCYRTIFDKNENPIGIEVLSSEELVEAMNSITNELYKPFNLNLDDFIILISN